MDERLDESLGARFPVLEVRPPALLFNSIEFVVFMALLLPLYYGLSHRWQNRALVVASYAFYAFWDWRFCSLLALSTVVDFLCARGIETARRPGGEAGRARALLLVSLCTNLGVLGFFKYFGFFVESASALLSNVGFAANLPFLHVVLPVGISFYTFQTLGYTVDAYRGHVRPTRDFTAFALYVSYFPQLVAGPIERASALLPQLEAPRRVDSAALTRGTQLILIGLLKKVCIADAVAPYVDVLFADPAAASAPDLVLGAYLFGLQIYGDFSGYTDIARGVSRLLGIELRVNFRQPYLSANITEFWRRWHISLSSWLRDYLYIPLGGNRGGRVRTYRNLMLTMLLGGLWHGAAWNFVVWGALHGLYLAVHRALKGSGRNEVGAAPSGAAEKLRFALRAFATFNLVSFAWVFFRAPTFADALAYLGGLGSGWTAPSLQLAEVFAFHLALVAIVDIPCWRGDREVFVDARWPTWRRGLVYAGLILLITFVGEPSARPFIYFQF